MSTPRPPKAPLPPMADYRPPQPMFVPCPQCGALTLRGKDGALLTPALGLEHTCKPTTTKEGPSL